MNRHKWLSLSLVVAVLASGGYLIEGIYTKIQRKSALQQSLSKLPAFQFIALDSSIIRTDHIPIGQPVILLFFSPDCEYCQAQAQSIVRYSDMFDNIQLIWIADENMALVRAFADCYAIDRMPNSKVVTAPSGEIKKSFGITQMPAVLIYDQQHHMVRQFRGETKWDLILAALHEQANIQQ